MAKFTRRCVTMFAILFFVCKVTAKQSCADSEDWCTSVIEYCDKFEVATLCPKTCDRCLEEASNNKPQRTCQEGFKLKEDKISCEDIDECTSSPCDMVENAPVCRNFPGSYICEPTCATSYKAYTRKGCCKVTFGKCGQDNPSLLRNRIIGGNASIPRWPWVGFIMSAGGFCDGILISDRWLVTTSSCLRYDKNARDIRIRIILGKDYIRNIERLEIKEASQIIPHDKYDIALVRMDSPNDQFLTSPVCLPNGQNPPPSTRCITVGFDLVSDTGRFLAWELKDYNFNIVSSDSCKNALKENEDMDPNSILCTVYTGKAKRPCPIDTGTPLVCQRCDSCDWYLAGVKLAETCDESNHHVFIKVEHIEKWIEREAENITVTKGTCIQQGQWGRWSRWGACSRTCGGGTKTRTRVCNNKQDGASSCLGPSSQSKKCNEQVLCVTFGQWSECSVTCGEGTQDRIVQSCAGLRCISFIQHRPCSKEPCTHWSRWGEWSSCSVSCGEGTQSSDRECRYAYHDENCKGSSKRTRKCAEPSCPGDVYEV